jgi:glycosyltransferase involved in cell wall biosynthesis
MDLPLTVLILTKNEEKAIQACVSSLLNVNQVIVVDSSSEDLTVEMAEKLGATVINFKWNGLYPKKKQWALNLPEIKNDWVLFLDADESVAPDFFAELKEIFDTGRHRLFGAFEIDLEYFFLGRLLRHGHKVRKRALVNRNYCSFPEVSDLHVKNMWEVEGHYQPNCEKSVGKMNSKIKHLDPDPLYDYFFRHNRYSDWEAELQINYDMRQSVRAFRSAQGAIFDRIPFKPLFFFTYSYLIRLGWRDGKAGFNYALALSFYYWQISVKTLEKKINAKTI